MRRLRGFTLIEALVTMAVVAVLVAAVAPSASQMLANMRLRGTSESLLSGLQKARSEAVKSNQTVSLWLVTTSAGVVDNSCQLSSSSRAWVVSYNDPTGSCGADPSTTVAPRIVQVSNGGTAGADLTVAAVAADGATAATQISFDGFGRRPLATAATDISIIDITSSATGTRRLRAQISPAGNVRICDRDAPVTTPPDPRAC